MAEITLFYIFVGAIGWDLLIGDPSFMIHPVQIIGIYIGRTTQFFIHNFKRNKRILFWGGLFVAFSSICISFIIGKLIELAFLQSKGNFTFGILIFLGLSSCLASKSLTSSVKEISSLIDNKTDKKNKERKRKE